MLLTLPGTRTDKNHRNHCHVESEVARVRFDLPEVAGRMKKGLQSLRNLKCVVSYFAAELVILEAMRSLCCRKPRVIGAMWPPYHL